MKKIMHLFKRDLENVSHSVIGLVVVLGLIIVPCLYAWFNIAGSWDPYGNTGNLKIAVVNTDKGYESDLVPVEVNIGETVTSTLRGNDSFDWTVVDDRDEAVDGVKSGKYYAAVVIPKSFSSDMMTLFSQHVKHADIEFYENQKANAIAQIVTEKGSTAVQSQVNESFAQTVSSIALKTAANLLDYMGSDQVTNFVANLSSTLGDSVQGLSDVKDNTAALTQILDSAASSLDSAGTLIKDNGTTSDSTKQLMTHAKSGLDDVKTALSGAKTAVNKAISDSTASLDGVTSSVDSAFAAASQHVELTVSQLNQASSELSSRASEASSLAEQIRVNAHMLDDGSVKERLLAVASSIDDIAKTEQTYADSLSKAASSLSSGMADVDKTKSELMALISQAKGGVTDAKGDYDTQLTAKADELKKTLSGLVSSASDISDNLDAAVNGLTDASGSLSKSLQKAGKLVTKASEKLESASGKLQDFKDQLDGAVSSGDLAQIKSLIGDDPDGLADALASPVSLDRKPIYPVRNYGSAMAPFYTILSLWVGSIVLAAMMKVSVDDELINELVPVRLHQIYLGRYLFFGLLALAQATLVCAGDILFFGIQCDNPLQFMLAGWVASLVFSNIVYTLTVSFGDIGKALAVVLLVMQVGGSGGTFPIEMTGPVFQAIYPFLPFTHGINAMHAAMAGAYHMEYWIELGILASYLIPSLALGVVFRRPVIKANDWIIEKLESTKLI